MCACVFVCVCVCVCVCACEEMNIYLVQPHVGARFSGVTGPEVEGVSCALECGLVYALTPSPHPIPPPPSLLHLTPPHPSLTPTPHPTPHIHTPLHPPSLYCTLQGTVDSMVLSDGGKGENSDLESEAVVTSSA